MAALAKAAKSLPRDRRLCLVDRGDRHADILNQNVDLAATPVAQPKLHDHRSLDIGRGREARLAMIDDGVDERSALRFVAQDRDQCRTVDDDQSNSPSLL